MISGKYPYPILNTENRNYMECREMPQYLFSASFRKSGKNPIEEQSYKPGMYPIAEYYGIRRVKLRSLERSIATGNTV